MKYVKPFRLARRTFIKGVGVACALPYLECMANEKTQNQTQAPKRLCYVYTPNGVSLPGENSPDKQWNWFPSGEGKNYQFTNVLESLEPLRNDLSVIGGLSHPKSRMLLGHIAGDTWLTGGDVRGSKYLNSISVDQYAANVKKINTRYPSLVLSADGGVGFKSRASTLSFDQLGNAIPSEHRHRQIFERYFSAGAKGSTDARRQSLTRGKKIVDLLNEDAKRLQKRLGKSDKLRLDAHMTSINMLEEQIKRNEQWLDVPLKAFKSDHLDLDVKADIDPQSYIRTMYDLLVLGFQLDLTHVATYMIAREDGMGFGDAYPKLALGLKSGHHKMTHAKDKSRWENWGRYDQWLSKQFSYFLTQMKNTEDEFGSLLDNTQILYGSCCSNTHNARNYPLILAGGKNMGLKHGRYTKFDQKTPMSNLFVNMLNSADVPVKSFSDSNHHMEKMANIFNV